MPIVTNSADVTVTNEILTAVREIQNDEMKLQFGPNPSNGYSNLMITGKLTGKFELRVIDNNGSVISQQTITRNSIAEKSYIFKIPVAPKVATNHLPTPLGAIGVSLNGVPFFNQYAGPNQPLTGEIVSFDRYWGHPAPTGQYHYHVEPLYLTTVKVTKSSLLGFLLDGFPVYGPEENGALVDNSKLDAYHGHTSVTTDFPSGIYHYHITNTDPYINGSGYYGTPGTVSQ